MKPNKLFIDDKPLDLPKNFKIARTKQVNTIGQLNNRQANYTQNVKLPKTKRNTDTLDYLGALGNTSSKPYILNKVRLYNDSGEVEIYDGIAIVRPTTSTYNIAIYDGFISFTKAIDNKVLTDVGLEELNHLKNITTVKNSWITSLNYKYIVADYNGKMIFNDRLNIDYLIPSVNLKFLWDKVHEYAGYTYEGSVFDTETFQNLWITYPKTIGDENQETLDVASFNWIKELTWTNTDPSDLTIFHSRSLTGSTTAPRVDNAYFYGSSMTTGILPATGVINNVNLTAVQTGLYKFRVSGVINKISPFGSGGEMRILKGVLGSGVPFESEVVGEWEYGVPFDFTYYINVAVGETIALEGGSLFEMRDTTGDVNTDLDIVTGSSVDFEEAFINFGIKDFINEVLWRYSLTPFKDKYENKIVYLTHQEWLQTTEVEDWSSDKNKYINKTYEGYKFGNYAQRNFLRYKYNDSNFNHNDSYLSILNENLKDEKTIIASKLFSPEPEKNTLLASAYNIYKFWEKEPKDDGTIKYKELSNRFYILRDEQVNSEIFITSESTAEIDSSTTYPRESFEGLSFANIVQDYYNPIYSIFNSARLIKANIFLNDKDISELDFTKLYFIKEEGSYFILNKIPNYIKKGVYRCEFIEVDLFVEESPEIPLDPRITLASVFSPANPPFSFTSVIGNDYVFYNYIPVDGVTIQAVQLTAHPLDGGVPTGEVRNDVIDESLNIHTFLVPNPITDSDCGWWEIQITDPTEGITSNTQLVLIPCPITNTDPLIYMTIESLSIVDNDVPILRDVTYIFYNFTPTSAVLKIQSYDFINGTPNGAVNTITGLTLNQDITNSLPDVAFLNGFGYYRIILETDAVTYDLFAWIF